jgi:hypothetical protein
MWLWGNKPCPHQSSKILCISFRPNAMRHTSLAESSLLPELKYTALKVRIWIYEWYSLHFMYLDCICFRRFKCFYWQLIYCERIPIVEGKIELSQHVTSQAGVQISNLEKRSPTLPICGRASHFISKNSNKEHHAWAPARSDFRLIGCHFITISATPWTKLFMRILRTKGAKTAFFSFGQGVWMQ